MKALIFSSCAWQELNSTSAWLSVETLVYMAHLACIDASLELKLRQSQELYTMYYNT